LLLSYQPLNGKGRRMGGFARVTVTHPYKAGGGGGGNERERGGGKAAYYDNK
jgi:hypothetical protein